MHPLPRVRAPELPAELEWIGVRHSLAALRGRWVLLDVWSSGCINCVHLVPVLEAIGRQWPDRLTIIGVHSGKFPAERAPDALAHAVARLGITHPVVNDRQFRVWRSYAIRAWPTLVLIDPAGAVVAQQAGEQSVEQLTAALVPWLGAPSGSVDGVHEASVSPIAPPAEGMLRYPTRLAVAADGERLALSDSGHHRVLLGRWVRRTRRIVIDRVIGGAAPRDAEAMPVDGATDVATFRDPQGIAFAGETLVVADRGHHAVRAIAWASGVVRTLAGNGHRAMNDGERAAGALASPVDVAVHAEQLVVAMAGAHQLWTMPVRGGELVPWAGSGAEGLHDGSRGEAAFAQPTGVARHGDGWLVVDSESSALRRVDGAGTVTTIVGAGLFDFGDRDGVGAAVRLQHPEAVAVSREGVVVVTDRYNGALKVVDPDRGAVRTLVRGVDDPVGVAAVEDGWLVVDSAGGRVVWCSAAGETGTVTLEWRS